MEEKRKETRDGRFGEIKRLCEVRTQKAVGGDNMWERRASCQRFNSKRKELLAVVNVSYGERKSR